MNGASKIAGQPSATTSGNSFKTAQWALTGVFVAATALLIARIFFSFRLPASGGECASAVLVLAFAATLVSLSGQLPAQNVLLAAVIIGLIGGGIHALGAVTGIPFGPVIYPPSSAPMIFNTLPWYFPMLWVVVILNSRGVARLILRPWRKLRVYGFWLMGITALLTLIFVLGLEPFATRSQHYWIWTRTKLPLDWHGAPLSDFLGWLVTTLLILAFSTPSLMKKRPAKSTPDYHPLIVWLSINLLFIAGSVSQHLWSAVVAGAIACVAVIPFAIRGARW
jgi:uncharacterized membrane protein